MNDILLSQYASQSLYASRRLRRTPPVRGNDADLIHLVTKTERTLHRNIWENHAFPAEFNPAVSLCPPTLPPRVAATSLPPDASCPVVFFTFLCYLTIGIPLAVLPGFVHTDLGLRIGDGGRGDQRPVPRDARLAAARRPHRRYARAEEDGALRPHGVRGRAACCCSPSALAAQWHAVSLALLIVGRLVLGFGESWVGTGSITWGIGRVGVIEQREGDFVERHRHLWRARDRRAARRRHRPFARLRRARLHRDRARRRSATGSRRAWRRCRSSTASACRIAACSSACCRMVSGLALGSAGFGSIATFITLFYAAHNWPNAALSLTVFGTMFVGARLLFANTIKTYGGFRVAIVSFAFECAGLLMLWLSAEPTFALAGAALTGFRLRARVSGARRRGGRTRAAREPWRGAVGVFGVSRFVARAYRAARGLCRGRVRLWIGVSVRGGRGGAGCGAVGRALYAHGARRRRAGDGLSCDPDGQTTLASVSVFYCLARAATRYSDVEVSPRAVIETIAIWPANVAPSITRMTTATTRWTWICGDETIDVQRPTMQQPAGTPARMPILETGDQLTTRRSLEWNAEANV